MNTPLLTLAAGLLMACAASALAAILYVDVNDTNPTPPARPDGTL